MSSLFALYTLRFPKVHQSRVSLFPLVRSSPCPPILHHFPLLASQPPESSLHQPLRTIFTSLSRYLTQHPDIRHLNLTYSSFDVAVLPDFLRFHLDHLTTNSNLRLFTLNLNSGLRSSLYPPPTSTEKEGVEELLLQILGLGRESSLEYIRFDSWEVFGGEEALERLVDTVEAGNRNLLGVLMGRRDTQFWRWNNLRERLEVVAARNRRSHIQTHTAANSLLPYFRLIFLQTRSSSPPFLLLATGDGGHPFTTLSSLPLEILRGILVELDTSPLSWLQVVKLLAYAEDRRTLVIIVEDRWEGEMEFLREVDCWKYDG